MKRRILTLLVIILIQFTFLSSRPAYAQCAGLVFPNNFAIIGKIGRCDLTTPAGFISAFLPAVLGILAFITVIIIVISGIQFILSSGNPEGAAAARGRLIYALVGFALIVLAFAILQIVNRLFLGPTGVA